MSEEHLTPAGRVETLERIAATIEALLQAGLISEQEAEYVLNNGPEPASAAGSRCGAN